MSTIAKTIDLDIIYAGLTVCVPIENVKNNSSVTVDDVIVKLDEIPDGLSYSSYVLGQGSYDELSLIWSVGALGPLGSTSGMLCFTVLDDSKAPFNFNLTVGLSGLCEQCDPLNQYCVTIKGLRVADLIAAGIIVPEPGIYDDDLDAAAGGVDLGKWYILSDTNTLGLPDGMVKKRVV